MAKRLVPRALEPRSQQRATGSVSAAFSVDFGCHVCLISLPVSQACLCFFSNQNALVHGL